LISWCFCYVHGRSQCRWSGRILGGSAGTRNRDPLLPFRPVGDHNFDRTIRSVLTIICRNITDRILRSQLAGDLPCDVWKLAHIRGEVGLAAALVRHSLEECPSLLLRALADKAAFLAKFAEEADDVDLHIRFAKQVKMLFFVVVAIAVLAVSYGYSSTAFAVIGLFGSLVFIYILGGKVNRVYD